MSPREFDELGERFIAAERRAWGPLNYWCGLLAAGQYNTSFAAPKKPIEPSVFQPVFADDGNAPKPVQGPQVSPQVAAQRLVLLETEAAKLKARDKRKAEAKREEARAKQKAVQAKRKGKRGH